VRVLGKDWHKWCFKCHICETTLQLGNYQDHDGEPYCKKCYGQAYGAQGFKKGVCNAYDDGKIADVVAKKKERKDTLLREEKEKEEREKREKEEAEAKRIAEEQEAARREAERQKREAEEKARAEAEKAEAEAQKRRAEEEAAAAKQQAEEQEAAAAKSQAEEQEAATAKQRAEEEAAAATEPATVEAASIAIRPSVEAGAPAKKDRVTLENQAQKEGYLTKAPTSGKQGLFKRDRRRYFKLDKTHLSFYQDASMFDLLKQFTVEGPPVKAAGAGHELKVPVMSTSFGSRTTLLKFENGAELSEWETALSAAAELAAM
jgi:hypothetical protein